MQDDQGGRCTCILQGVLPERGEMGLPDFVGQAHYWALPGVLSMPCVEQHFQILTCLVSQSVEGIILGVLWNARRCHAGTCMLLADSRSACTLDGKVHHVQLKRCHICTPELVCLLHAAGVHSSSAVS